MHLFGDAVSPALMGLCDGNLFPDAGFHLVAWMILAGGVLWLLGVPHLDRDTELAATRG